MCRISPRSARRQFATIELLRRMAVVSLTGLTYTAFTAAVGGDQREP